ncbi:hypothetical protein HPB52_007960 [Rhipicephalus sanguineus]|uniref:Splicing factor 3A subunit 2 n=2 Tax=Rhipicephalus sanguineus TaxID=34632 RepID=A0A9D4Q688_RHISA|nr:hypothetical protein HPB52_007960 [Rhipicephalus sanguineus]
MNQASSSPSSSLHTKKRNAKRDPNFTYEVIIVDDGSRDRTTSVGLQYSLKYGTENVRVLTLAKNRGKGGAVRMGMLSARGKRLLFADADGATKFSDLDKLEDSTNVVVVGSRAHLEKDSIAERSIFRTLLMYGFHFLVWLFTVRGVADTQCGFKLFSREAATHLFTSLHVERWAFDVEILYIAQALKFPIAEVAVRWTEIEGSKVVPVWTWIEMGRDLFLIWLRYKIGESKGDDEMDFQHRPGGKTGSGGVASWSESNRDRRERLRQLALETIDLQKDPYFMKNHLGSYECKLCLTLHNNEGSYLAHTQGKKHQANLARRAAKEAKDSPIQPAPAKPRVDIKKFVKIGRPGYRVTKQRDGDTGQQSLLFQVDYPEVNDNVVPRHRFMSAYEQKVEPPDKKWQYLLFAAEPYETIAFKVPSREVDKSEGRFWTLWNRDSKQFFLQFSFKLEAKPKLPTLTSHGLPSLAPPPPPPPSGGN